MKKFLTEIIIDPASAKSLLYDETQNVLHADDYESIYKISGDVPVILPGNFHLSRLRYTKI